MKDLFSIGEIKRNNFQNCILYTINLSSNFDKILVFASFNVKFNGGGGINYVNPNIWKSQGQKFQLTKSLR